VSTPPAPSRPAAAACAPPQHVAVIDAVGAQHHREEHRHHLAARVGSARPVPTQPDQPLREGLDSQALRERRDQRIPASETTRSSSKITRSPSSQTGSSSCTTKVTS
jgi:hypothetical protein